MSNLTIKFETKNGIKSIEALGKEARTCFDKADTLLFNGGVICAHLSGMTIPQWNETIKTKDENGDEIEETITHKEIKGYQNPKTTKVCGLSYKTIADMVGKSKATVNNYVNAIEVAINNGLFEALAQGIIKFNIQKMRYIDANRDILIDDLHTFEELMSYSEDSLENMVKAKDTTTNNTTNSNNNSNDGDNNDDNNNNENSIEVAMSIDNKLYKGSLPKSVIDEILEKYFTEVVNEETTEK